jgi:phosphate-selective porin OprO and OprP
VGLNYYFAGHNLKLQLDYFRLWGADQGPGFVNAAKHGTDRVRLQVQLAF